MLKGPSDAKDASGNTDDLDFARRRNLGIYYTPQGAAALLARWAIRTATDSVLEPSFGGCAILEASVDRLRSLGSQQPANQLFGFDVDAYAFDHLEKLIGTQKGSHFKHRDFLAVSALELQVTTVIANPPFVSYHRMNDAQREVIHSWRMKYAPQFSMTASLWAYFIVHSLAFLKPSGRIAFVLPSAAITSDYSKPILFELQRRFSSLLVCRVNEQLFIQAGAEERAVIVFAEGYCAESLVLGNRTDVHVAKLNEIEKHLQSCTPEAKSSASEIGLTLSLEKVRDTLQQIRNRGNAYSLGEEYTVSIGEVVGDTEFFVKEVTEWNNLRIPQSKLRPIITRMRQLDGLRVSKKDISSKATRIRRLIRPGIGKQSKAVRKYFESYPQSARKNNKTFRKREPWYDVSYECSAAAFIGSLANESPKVVLNSANISCANGLYKLKAKSTATWKSWLAASSLTTIFRLSGELEARVLGAGGLKLEPSDVLRLLLPANVSGIHANEVKKLVSRLDRLLRRGEYEAATQEADRMLLVESGAISNAEYISLRKFYKSFRNSRKS